MLPESDLKAEMIRVMEEEIFGPLLPVLGYHSLDDVIRAINDQPKPLSLYVWSRSSANIDKVLKNTSSGGACVNHSVVQFSHVISALRF